MSYSQVFISAELRTQGFRILDHLLSQRLIFGGPVINGPAKFLWKNEVVEHDYCYIVTYTRDDLKHKLIEEAESVSVEEVCMISFAPLDGSPALIRLLDEAFGEGDTMLAPRPKDGEAAITFVPTSEIPKRTKRSFSNGSTVAKTV